MTVSQRVARVVAVIVLLGCDQKGGQTTQSQDEAPVRQAGAAQISSSGSANAAQQPEQRRMWDIGPGSEEVYDISPDGRHAGYIDWSTGELWVRDLERGTSRNLTNKGSYEQTLDEAESARFSADGRLIAYEWWDAKTRGEEVRIISIDGTGPRTLLRVPSDVAVWPESWTPDGKYILTDLDHDDGRREVVMVSSTGAANRTLMTVPRRAHGDFRISRDGRYVAWGVAPDNDDVRRNIHIKNLQNDRESVLIRNPGYSKPIGWTRDGRLVFAAERGGTPGLWTIRVVDGRAQGEPQLIRGDLWHMNAIRVTDDGRFFYNVRAGDRDVFTAAFDATTGRLQSPPVSVTKSPGEDYVLPAWSPDGRYVAYRKRTPWPQGFQTITVRSLEGNESRELRPRVANFGAMTWLPNGQSMMLTGTDEQGRQTMFRFDLNTGTTRAEVVTLTTIPAFSKDSRFMYYSPRTPNADSTIPWRLVERDLTSGREREVYVAPAGTRIIGAFAVVDAQRTVLVQTNTTRLGGGPRGLLAVSIDNRDVRNLGREVPFDSVAYYMRAIGLTPGGNDVLVTTSRVHGPNYSWSELWRVPLAGGPAIRLADLPNIQRGAQAPGSLLSPDGRRILYWSGDLSSEIWMLDDPKLTARSSSTPR